MLGREDGPAGASATLSAALQTVDDAIVMAVDEHAWILTTDGQPRARHPPRPGILARAGPRRGVRRERLVVLRPLPGHAAPVGRHPDPDRRDTRLALGRRRLGAGGRSSPSARRTRGADGLTARSARTGTVLWHLPGPIVTGLLLDGTLYVATSDALVAVDATTGRTEWRTPLDYLLQQLSTDGRYLLVPGLGVTLDAYALRDGSLAWHKDLAQEVAGDRDPDLRAGLPVGLARPPALRLDGQRRRRGAGLTGRAMSLHPGHLAPVELDEPDLTRTAGPSLLPAWLRRHAPAVAGATALLVLALLSAQSALDSRERQRLAYLADVPGVLSPLHDPPDALWRWAPTAGTLVAGDQAGRWAIGALYHRGGVDLQGTDPDTGHVLWSVPFSLDAALPPGGRSELPSVWVRCTAVAAQTPVAVCAAEVSPVGSVGAATPLVVLDPTDGTVLATPAVAAGSAVVHGRAAPGRRRARARRRRGRALDAHRDRPRHRRGRLAADDARRAAGARGHGRAT